MVSLTAHVGILSATFLAAAVEWVEAFTVVLAVALSVGWTVAGTAALSALVTIGALVTLGGGALDLSADIGWIRLAIGAFLLLFGLRWYAKAIAREAGRKALHDEAKAFRETTVALAHAEHRAAWVVAYKGVFVEGLEVWLIIVALGHARGMFLPATGSALLALLVVAAAGMLLRAPLARVPENAMKSLVASALLSFGTFWTLEALGGRAAWPLGDVSIVLLFAVYGAAGWMVARALRASAAAWQEES